MQNRTITHLPSHTHTHARARGDVREAKSFPSASPPSRRGPRFTQGPIFRLRPPRILCALCLIGTVSDYNCMCPIETVSDRTCVQLRLYPIEKYVCVQLVMCAIGTIPGRWGDHCKIAYDYPILTSSKGINVPVCNKHFFKRYLFTQLKRQKKACS